MAKALATATMSEDEAMIVLAPINFATAREHLPALRSPTYAALARNAQSAEGGERAKVDVSDMLAHDTPENVRKTVSGLIVEEISRVLRLPREDVSRTKALSEIGLDSLMAVELALGLEERFGLKGSLSASASGFTVVELADHVVNLATGSMTGEDSIAKGMVGRHLGNDVDAQALEAASALVWQKSRSVKDILH
jgi:acyl carrier protein